MALDAADAKGRSPRRPTRPESEQVKSLVRALALLNRISGAADGGATLTELAQQVGLPPSTAHRLLTTLEQERYVRFDQDRRQWSVGVQAFVIGCTFTKTRSLVGQSRPYMRRLMEDSGETVNLAIEDQGEMVYLAQVECRQMMRAFARPGARVPLHCSGVGKAILSAVGPRALAKFLHRRGMARLTAKTITSPAALRADLDRARTLATPSTTRRTPSGCVASRRRSSTRPARWLPQCRCRGRWRASSTNASPRSARSRCRPRAASPPNWALPAAGRNPREHAHAIDFT
jgi:IclR family transcriptional regulator, acetate operon repressor